MSRVNSRSKQAGFTLVEMLIIAPIALLVITSFVVLMVMMVGDAIISRSQNVMTYDVQSALTTIERDVRLSTQFLTTSGTLPSPQGKNGSTSAFTSTSGDLVLGMIATDKNPSDPTRSFIYYDTPSGCGDLTELYRNRIFFTTVTYTVRDNSLWRRTYVPDPAGTLCQPHWQVNTCAPGYTSGQVRCKTNDSEILKNIKTFEVNYYANPEDTVAIAPSAADGAESIRVMLEAEQAAAGRTFSVSSSAKSTKLSSQEVTLAPPDAPTITATNSGNETIFRWNTVPLASSYIVEYNVVGTGTNIDWITVSENFPGTIFSIPANHGDTVSVRVRSRNTTGASAVATAATTIPLWTPCDLQNGWTNYGSPYANCSFTITRDGVVMFKGMIKDGATTTNVNLFQLPPYLRPSSSLMFQTAINPNSSTRIDIRNDGWVRLASGTSNTYVGLDGIYFIPQNSLYNWTTPTLLNSWTNFGGGFSPLQYTQDASGRVHVRGIAQQGTVTTGTNIATITGLGPQGGLSYFPARGGNNYNLVGITSGGAIQAQGINQYVSTQIMYYPSSYSGWTAFSPAVAGNPLSGELGNGWINQHATNNPTAAYTKSDDGIVTLKGHIRSGGTSNNTAMARLPTTHRPAQDLSFSVVTSGGTAGRLDIDTNGYLRYRAGSNTWLSLNNISFIAE